MNPVTTEAQSTGILAIDAGNSKTDVAIVAADGTLLASARGGGFRPHIVGPARAVQGLVPLVAQVAGLAGLEPDAALPLTRHVSACLANSDLPVETERLEREIAAQAWGVTTFVGNDTFALLRAGVDEPRGVAVICGAGINCLGLAPDGRTATFAAVGRISGDWGEGGTSPRRRCGGRPGPRTEGDPKRRFGRHSRPISGCRRCTR